MASRTAAATAGALPGTGRLLAIPGEHHRRTLVRRATGIFIALRYPQLGVPSSVSCKDELCATMREAGLAIPVPPF
jgi:hypothetical protein